MCHLPFSQLNLHLDRAFIRLVTENPLTLLRRTFAAEAQTILEQLEANLLEIQAGENNPDQINAIFRAAHTLKGSALAVEFDQLGELAHIVEELFSRWRDDKVTISRAQVDWAVSALGMLNAELATALGEEEKGASVGSTARRSEEAERTLGVSIRRLDELLDLVGEVIVARERMTSVLSTHATPTSRIREVHEDTEPLYAELQERVMGLRLVSMGPLAKRLSRVAADVAKKLGKEVRFETNAHDMEVDASLVDALRDPLLHMVRNSLDHGIEHPEARRAAGKDAQGRVTMQVRRESGQLVVELSDDGAGINRARVAMKAREAGYQVDAKTLTDSITESLIFRAGSRQRVQALTRPSSGALDWTAPSLPFTLPARIHSGQTSLLASNLWPKIRLS